MEKVAVMSAGQLPRELWEGWPVDRVPSPAALNRLAALGYEPSWSSAAEVMAELRELVARKVLPGCKRLSKILGWSFHGLRQILRGAYCPSFCRLVDLVARLAEHFSECRRLRLTLVGVDPPEVEGDEGGGRGGSASVPEVEGVGRTGSAPALEFAGKGDVGPGSVPEVGGGDRGGSPSEPTWTRSRRAFAGDGPTTAASPVWGYCDVATDSSRNDRTVKNGVYRDRSARRRGLEGVGHSICAHCGGVYRHMNEHHSLRSGVYRSKPAHPEGVYREKTAQAGDLEGVYREKTAQIEGSRGVYREDTARLGRSSGVYEAKNEPGRAAGKRPKKIQKKSSTRTNSSPPSITDMVTIEVRRDDANSYAQRCSDIETALRTVHMLLDLGEDGQHIYVNGRPYREQEAPSRGKKVVNEPSPEPADLAGSIGISELMMLAVNVLQEMRKHAGNVAKSG